MTSLRFSPLCGAHSEDPLCYLLEIDETVILLDCGWNDAFDERLLEPLRQVLPRVSCVLISHGDSQHLGALPYVVGKMGLDVPIYVTLPVYNMGYLHMYDVYLSIEAGKEFETFSLDDVDAAFDHMVTLKYTQHVNLTGNKAGKMGSSTALSAGSAITITPYPAGHTLGGTIWKITKDTDEVVYAVDYNHRKERHLDGTLLETLTRPSLLISNAAGFTSKPSMNRKARDKLLIERTIGTLRHGGDVLIPTDTSLRVLELLLFFSQYWSAKKLTQYGIVLYSHSAYSVAQQARSQLEWMSDALQMAFDQRRTNPFDLNYVYIALTPEDLNSVPRPMVVLASHPSLEYGYARDLFVEKARSPANLVVFPTAPPSGTLGATLTAPGGPPGSVSLRMDKRIPLMGEELEEALRLREEKRAADAEAAAAAAAAMVNPEDELMDNLNNMMMDSDNEGGGGAGTGPSTKASFDLMVSRDAEGTSFFKKSQAHPLFPHRPPRDDIVGPMGAIVDTSVYAVGEYMVDERQSAGGYIFGGGSGSSGAGGKGDGGGASNGDGTSDNYGSSMEAPVGNLLAAMDLEDPLEARMPTKCMSWVEDIPVRASILSLDYEGVSDGLSMKKILEHVAPRRLIVVHGTADETTAMVDYCKASEIGKEGVMAPVLGDVVDLSSSSAVYQIKLKDAMTSSLSYKEVDNYDIAYFDGLITYPEATNVPVLEHAPDSAGHDPIFIGDVQLYNLRQILADAGHSVDFSVDGVLVVDDVVGVRRVSSGELVIEGVFSDTYFKVRSVVYGQYTVF